MEQRALYNALNLAVQATPGADSSMTPMNTTVYLSSLATYLCPSDTGSSVFKYGTNYGASIGPQFRSDSPRSSSKGTGSGLFANKTVYGIRDCTDGTSNTIAFGEGIIGDNTTGSRNGAESYNCQPWPSGSDPSGSGADQLMPGAIANLNKYIVTCNSLRTGTTNQANDVNSYWAAGRMIQGPIINELLTPNSRNQDCYCFAQWDGLKTCRSRHPGGVNVLFADGSGRFIKDSINQLTWWALGTKAGGEVISADSY
jgi:prepilin-type processing-associated H-X9-DG protein